jgi:hypothetical protein
MLENLNESVFLEDLSIDERKVLLKWNTGIRCVGMSAWFILQRMDFSGGLLYCAVSLLLVLNPKICWSS